jgi:Transposase domain (DUF772)
MRIAQAAFPKGHRYLRLADELGILFTDTLFTDLFPTPGQSALTPWRLALVSILQFAQGLSDRQAADAVRSRIDWKYVLRLLNGGAEELLFDTLLTWCREHQLREAPYPSYTGAPLDRENWFVQKQADAWAVVLDSTGKIAWGRSEMGGDPLVVPDAEGNEPALLSVRFALRCLERIQLLLELHLLPAIRLRQSFIG